MSSGWDGCFMLFFPLLLLTEDASAILPRSNSMSTSALEEYQISTVVNKNISLPCWPQNFPHKNNSIYWEISGPRRQHDILDDGSLFIRNLSKSDSRLYICRTVDEDFVLKKIRLYVRGPPSMPENVSAETGSRSILVSWSLAVDEQRMETETISASSTVQVSLRYRLADGGRSSWGMHGVSIPETKNTSMLFGLKPNSIYEVELWTHNEFGRSQSVVVRCQTLEDGRADSSDGGFGGDVQSPSSPSSETSVRSLLTALAVLLFLLNVLGVLLLVSFHSKNRRLFLPRLADAGRGCEQIELIPNIIENPTVLFDSESESSFYDTPRPRSELPHDSPRVRSGGGDRDRDRVPLSVV